MSREHLNTLLDEACSLACYFLEKNREFFPFAVAMNRLGEIRHVQAYTGSERPSSSEVVELLETQLANDALRGEIIACAVVKDIRLTPVGATAATDAVSVALEHHTEDPVVCFLPYSFDEDELVPREIIAERGQRRIFPSASY